MNFVTHELDEMPTTGQFTAGWIYEGTDCCGTFKWIGDKLHYFSANESWCGEWIELKDPKYFDYAETVVYFKLEKNL